MSANGGSILDLGNTLLPKRKVFRAADLFCGAGGTSTGAMRAARELGATLDLVAVNHWDVAIATHTRNHPDASHHCADLENMRPRAAVPGGVLDILMASPTCTFYSRARGGRPVHDQQRMDPWHVVRWCTELRVHRLLVENVPEMMDWGPCDIRSGRPIPSRKGEYFRAWIAALEGVGMRVKFTVIRCADFGDPTTRERFFLIGRSDKKTLRWPEASHAKGGASDLFGARAPWRAAREIIDWGIQGKSIFTRKRPLKPNTIRRILAGAIRYHWPAPHIAALQALLDGREPLLDVPAEAAQPFLIQFRGTDGGQLQRAARSIEDPVSTLTAGGGHHALVMASASGGEAREVTSPVPTITGAGSAHFIEPLLMGVGSSNAAKPTSDPAPTITTGGGSSPIRPGNARPQLIEPLLAPYYGGGSGLTAQSVLEPVPAVTTKARFGVAEPMLLRANHGDSDGRDPASRVLDAGDPLPAQTGSNEFGLAQPVILPTTHQGDARVRGVEEPLPTVTGANRGELGVSEPIIVTTSYSGAQVPRSADAPLRSITTAKGGDMAMSQAIVMRGNVGDGRTGDMRPASEPMPTVTCSESLALSTPFLVPNFGERHGQEPRTHGLEEPLPTVTAQGHIQIAEPAATEYRIDILYRMLHWRELARAMSFDDEGEVYDFAGTATEITKQIGNAVPGRTAKALVRALLEH
jgi:DNA (cytosine-5)-methyltransferase 1